MDEIIKHIYSFSYFPIKLMQCGKFFAIGQKLRQSHDIYAHSLVIKKKNSIVTLNVNIVSSVIKSHLYNKISFYQSF